MKGKCYSSVEVFRQANWNGTLVIDWAKEEAKMAKIIRHIYVYY